MFVDTGFYDEVGGYHAEANGWSPYGVYCGECTSSTCKGCTNIDISFNARKKEAIKAAEQLRYSDDVIEKINNAKNESEITRILATARKGLED